MRKVIFIASFVSLLIVGILNYQPAVVQADWDTTTPYTKWVQLPTEFQGLDVNATYADTGASTPQPVYPWQKILADDFPCYQSGPITDIHIWGSWLNDQIPFVSGQADSNLQNVSFKLSIHSDVPKNPTNQESYSHPGEELWSWVFKPGEYKPNLWKENTNEYFYEPNTNQIIGDDTQIWQYNFYIDPSVAFKQEGTAAVPKVYWLDVQAIIPEAADQGAIPDYVFGWKTTDQQWGDDAVYGDTLEPGKQPYDQFPDPDDPTGGSLLPWKDMIYPIGPYARQSLNLAFAITTVPEPGTLVMLFGACVFGFVAYMRRR
jgi:hypothetical protein